MRFAPTLSIPAFCLALVALEASGAQAEPAPATVIVMDGSGSMGGPLEGQPGVKFYLARDGVRKALEKANPAAPLGLVAFGHRRKGNCSDVEIVGGPAPGSAQELMTRLDAIDTVGKGPLVQAVREAAKLLEPDAAASLVLIHDGADNCRQDVCQAAADLARTHPRLAVHVISITQDTAVVEAMRCLAKTTGGQHFEAGDTAAIEAGIEKALDLAGLTGSAPRSSAPGAEADARPEPDASASEGPPRVRLTAALAEDGAPLTRAVKWRVASASDPAKALIETMAPEIASDLAAGDYIVEARLDLAAATSELSVAEKGETAKRIALDAGLLRITAASGKAGEALQNPVTTVFSVRENEGDGKPARTARWVGRAPPQELVLPSGDYVVRVADGLAVKEAPLSVPAGSSAAADFVMGVGRLELSARAGRDGPELDAITFSIEVDDPDAPQGRREIARSASPRPDFLLTAGTYYATARLGTAETRERIAIGTGDIVKQSLVLDLGRLSLKAEYDSALAPPGLSAGFRVFAMGQGEREVAHSSAASPDLFLPEGRYRIEAKLGALPLKAETVVDLSAGQSSEAVLNIEAAELTIRTDAAQRTSGADTLWWEVRDNRGHVVLRSSQGHVKTAILTPGRYALRSEQGSRRTERPFELEAGERMTIDPAF